MAEIFHYQNRDKGSYDPGNWIVVGKVLKTVGLNGWLRVSLESDNPDRFVAGARLFARHRNGDPEPCLLAEVREHFSGTKVEIRVEGVENRDDASRYVSAFLVIPFEERRELSGNTYYPDELVGMSILSLRGEKIGRLVKLEADVPSPYLVVDSEGYGEVLIPFMKRFISEINREENFVRLQEPIEIHVPGN